MTRESLLMAGLLVVAIALAITGRPCRGESPASELTYDRLEHVSVVDGDTIHGDIYLGRSVALRDQSIRLLGYDAWESRAIRRTVGPITAEEVVRGKLAAAELDRLLATADVLLLSDGGTDPYGRPLGYLIVVTKDGTRINVETYMLERGHDRTGAKP